MSRELFGVEIGHAIYAENGDLLFAMIGGTAIPDGTSGKQQAVPIGSLYVRSGTGELYQKIANAGAPADWELNGAGSLSAGNWRNEKVRFATADTLVAGSVDVLALSDNDDMVYGDIAVGEYVIGDVDGTPLLFEVTATPGTPNITVAAAGTALADNDTFVVQQYLPDPTTQEGQAIVHFPLASGAGVKVGDINWDFATGINLSSGYTAGNGSLTSADSVESGMEKLDGNQQDIQTASGIAQGAVDYGTFTGAILPDNADNKALHQAMETAVEEIDQNVDDLITLSGMPENSTDLGTFTGSTISDNVTVKVAFQEVETAIEAIRTDLGPANIAQSTPTVVDSVLVDECQRAEWMITVHDQGTPGAVQSMRVTAFHNGHAGADATLVQDKVYDKDKIGANFNFAVSVVLSGAAGTQAMDLTFETSDADGIRYTVSRIGCTSAL